MGLKRRDRRTYFGRALTNMKVYQLFTSKYLVSLPSRFDNVCKWRRDWSTQDPCDWTGGTGRHTSAGLWLTWRVINYLHVNTLFHSQPGLTMIVNDKEVGAHKTHGTEQEVTMEWRTYFGRALTNMKDEIELHVFTCKYFVSFPSSFDIDCKWRRSGSTQDPRDGTEGDHGLG